MGDKKALAFTKDIFPKVNLIAGLEFELAYDDVVAQHRILNSTGTSSDNFNWMTSDRMILMARQLI